MTLRKAVSQVYTEKIKAVKLAFSKLWPRAKRMLIWALAVLVSLSLILALLGFGYIRWQKSRTAKAYKITTANGIQELKAVELGGIEQWISIRGEDRDNPVILFLHDGPGMPAMPFIREGNQSLEEHFVVVNWDQRRAGKSYDKAIPAETMTLEQFVADCLELVDYLRADLNTDKIYLAGHSWGSVVGVHAVKEHPEWFYAYIGIGQAVNFVQSEIISYRYTMDQARKTNYQALTELREIDPPPYGPEDYAAPLEIQRKWLFAFGGEVYGEKDSRRHQKDLLRTLIYAPEYTIMDGWNAVRGNLQSVEMMWSELLQVDLLSQVPSLEVPVYFIHGRHDYVTAWELMEEYYQVLEVPAKQLIWFDFSAHSPHLEQPKGFARVMVERVLAETGNLP